MAAFFRPPAFDVVFEFVAADPVFWERAAVAVGFVFDLVFDVAIEVVAAACFFFSRGRL
ncbi:MAG: hypothetical protein WBS17_01910 [Candidatus Acidiferrales bacterium]